VSETHEELEREAVAQYRMMMRGLKATIGQAWMQIDLTLPQLRTLLVLAEEGPLVIGQIAQRLGEPLGTVKTRVRLGMNKLRQALPVLSGETH